MYRRWGKRAIDILGAGLTLVVLSPVLLVSALVVATRLGRPVLFKQKRAGLGSQAFNVLKFRSMTDARDPDGTLRPDSERLTPLGVFLRESSIDELPSLLNVLKGEMSLIGPRPFIYDYVDLYTPEQARRHDVRPGITGWAQVNGRNALSWEEKFRLDVWYVDNVSLWLDIKIVFLTLKKLIQRDGISAPGSATMERFRG
ncbi:MAG: sugar transferase [Brevundimonas sp.]|uniref:sugar transferase n=1 Tax=Brevundimonas sp. TaxID=1871086 RepID=UPI00275CA430|nr:sugar transferase [Brevundimonas sp.]MDP3401390.1 sugar transferase [Brevundimonas sp.]MDZ4109873.1 sugar transferase [Brevundimonas sp.]